MNVEYANALISTARKLLAEIGCTSVKCTEISAIGKTYSASERSSVAIGLNGGMDGSVFVIFSCSDVARLASLIIGTDISPDEDENVRECMAEFANMLAGRAEGEFSELGVDVGITPPAIVSGPEIEIQFQNESNTVLSYITTDQGSFDLISSLKRI